MTMQAVMDETRELLFTRTFDAPRDLVWQAWTDPKHIGAWWGPDGFTTTVEKQELKAGGSIVLNLQGPDGRTYPCRGVYREIKKPEKIVYSGIADDDNPCGAGLPPRSTVTVTFAEKSGRTTVTILTQLENPADRDAVIAHGFRQGWEASFDHLAQHLASVTGS
jgi:uncharacterized protein YndB with AHSA1/START domain